VGQSTQIGFDAIRDRVYSGVVKRIAPAGTVEGNVVVFPIEVEIIGSISGEFQKSGSGTSSQPPADRLLSSLPEDQRDALRKQISDLRAQGADREEIRSVIEKALAEHGGAQAPAGRPEPGFGLPQGGEMDQAGIALIKPGMTADLDIIIARAENVLCVPKEAVIEQNGGAMVTLLEGEKSVPRPVTLGLQDDVSVEVREGLQEGDEVVITGSQSALRQQSGSVQAPPPGGPPM